MNLSDAKYLEYSLAVFRECLMNSAKNDYSEYKIVWKYNEHLITGNVVRWNSPNYGFPHPVNLKLALEFEPYDEILPLDNSSKFPRNIREAWFDKYQGQFSVPAKLYLTPEALLPEMINFIESLDLEPIDNLKTQMYNVNFLDNDVHLDFMLLDTNSELIPVSLVKVSEN